MNDKKQVLVAALLMTASYSCAQNAGKELAPAAQKQASAKEEKIDYGPGIDTLEVGNSGNWLLKRVIWQDAEALYEKIQNAEHRVLEARLSFFEKRGNSDKVLNVFYSTIGFDQGELDEILDTLLAKLEQMKDRQGALNDQERSIQAKLLEKKNDIEQLKSDMKFMTDLDAALDNAVMQVVNQITLTTDYERQAWQKFKDIGQELDDRKAKEYYLQMDAQEKNIVAIEGYFKGALTEYFDKVSVQLNEYTDSIKTKLAAIKQSGIELKTQIAEIEEAAKKQPELPKKKATGWFDTIAVVWRYPLSWIMSLWNALTALIWALKNKIKTVLSH